MPSNTRALLKLFRRISRKVMGTMTHVATTEAVAALTFDDGPDPESTPRVLDVLNKYHAHATFFMIGTSAKRFPDLVQQIAQSGHAIGNHGWDHTSFPLLSAKERRAQLWACQEAISPYGLHLFRPPYGHQNVASRLDALLLGYDVIGWNLAAYDWLDRDACWMADRLENKVRPGCIVVLHDVLYHAMDRRHIVRDPMIEALDILLERVSGHFRFVTIPELLRCGRSRRRNWYLEADLDWLSKLERFGSVE